MFDNVLEQIQSVHRTRAFGYEARDVIIHVVRGDKEQAIDSLRLAVNFGWRDTWYRLRAPIFDSMLDEPEWLKLIARLEEDAEFQRQWHEKHKDDPLF